MTTERTRILICLTATRRWYGRIVRWATRSRVNHSLIKHEDPFWGGWRATEINEDGVSDRDVGKLTRIDYIEHWESDLDLLPGMRALRTFVGSARYDGLGLASGLIRAIILRVFGIEIDKPIHSHGRLFCSEFVAHVFKKAGVPGVEDWKPANVSPGTLRAFMESSPHFRRVAEPEQSG